MQKFIRQAYQKQGELPILITVPLAVKVQTKMSVISLASRASSRMRAAFSLSSAILLSALISPSAHAQQSRDFTYGGDARSYAMGGAGLAL
jgi:hypothetical protein